VSRSWRFGQTKTVHVHNVLVRNSIEEQINRICDAKEEMAKTYLEGSRRGGNMKLDAYTMGEILGVY